MLSMLAAGYHATDIARMLDRDERTVARVVSEHRKAQRDAHAAEFEEMYMMAAKVAATNGDHKPALEWLDRHGAIPESSRQRTAILQARLAAEGQAAATKHLQAAGHSPTIQIGIAMPGQLPVSSELGQTPKSLELPVISGAYMRPAAGSDE
jgi:hypothetical protein